MIANFTQIFGFAIGGLLISLIINILLLRFSESLGIRNKNDVIIRWSNQSKPSLGGVSFYIAFLFATIVYSILYHNEPSVFHNKEFVGLFTAGSLAFLMGLADDAYNTKPLIKLAIQISCGLIFVYLGSVINLTHIFWADAMITVCWVVAIMNSLNMLDNMDGITGTVVLFILLSCLVSYGLVSGISRNIWSIILVAQLGALLGFLKLNIHPSKLFMGDAGSQFIALFVAFYTIKNLWNIGQNTYSPSWTGLLVCFVAFTPAFADTLTVVINRLRKGQSPMVGGKDHTTHHLVYAGMNDKQVWYTFLVISLVSFILSSLMIYCVSIHLYWPLYICPLYTIVIFLVLFRLTHKYAAKIK